MEGLRRRARVLLDLGRADGALAEIRRALAINPFDPESLEIEGLCHLRRGAPADAIPVLARAIANAPASAHAFYLYGFALREVGRHREAEPPLTDALRRAPDEPVYLRALAELYADLGRHAESLRAARRAAEVAPERAANHITYGYAASAAGDKRLARAEYEVAVTLDPNDAAAWNNLGCLDLEAGQPLKARLRFRESLRLDPQSERARRNFSMVAPRRPRSVRNWSELLAELMRELVSAGASRAKLAALAIEEPESALALVRGGGAGATAGGLVTMIALRAMGWAAIAPIAAGAAVAGATWLVDRQAIAAARARTRKQLAEGRAEFDRAWAAWLDGSTPRASRDLAIEILVEKMALALVDET